MTGVLAADGVLWRRPQATAAGLYFDGRDYYRALYATITQARRSIVITGWQFDSEVALVRGADIPDDDRPRRLLPLLQDQCNREPELRIHILAWDYSIIYSLERELMQRFVFHWTSHQRIRFVFDNSHPVGGSHHQKMVLVDGEVAFAGGLDVCADRWDDRRHPAESPHRINPREKPFGPYHDIQAMVRGPAVADLAELFEQRWRAATGEQLTLPKPTAAPTDPAAGGIELPPPSAPLPAGPVAISRTFGKAGETAPAPAREIQRLYEAAIAAAERFLYIENQYLSSHAIRRALVERMRAADRPRLNIALILPGDLRDMVEQIGVGKLETDVIADLRRIAAETDTPLGIYASQARGGHTPVHVYIHSKLLIADDRFLTAGSANTTNRSMGLDSELNLSWEADDGDTALVEAIRGVRLALTGDMAGGLDPAVRNRLAAGDNLVRRMDALADDPSSRLVHRPDPHPDEQHPIARALPRTELFDPARAPLEEEAFEQFKQAQDSFFAKAREILEGLGVGGDRREP